MTIELDDYTKGLLRRALDSHQTCFHEDATLCHMLILAEVAFIRGDTVTSDEEIEASGAFIADAVLESLILKGMVEVIGISEDGDFELGLTEEGAMVEEAYRKENGEL